MIMPPEELLQVRIVQIDVIVCWMIYILKAMILPSIIASALIVEHSLSKSIRKDKARAKLHRLRKE